MRLESRTGVSPFYENFGKELDIKRYRLDTSWKVRSLLAVIPSRKISSVLEVGCGGGLVLKGISKAMNANKKIGVDIATSMLTIAQKECPDGLFIKGDVEYLPFKDCSVDLAVLSDILEHIEHPNILLKEVQRISKYIALKIPLERCLILELLRVFKRKKYYGLEHHRSGHLHAWNKKEALSLLSSAGLTLSDYRLVEPPNEIRYYGTTQNIAFRAKLQTSLEKSMFKYARRIYRLLYGSTLVAFAEVNRTGSYWSKVTER